MWRRSLAVLIILVVVGFGVLIARLFQLQVVQSEELKKAAVGNQLASTTINAQRGSILDCNNKPLAESANVWTVVLEPVYLKDDAAMRETVITGLASILSLDEADLREKAENTSSYYTIIQKRVESDVKDQILQFKEENGITSGIRLIEDYKRYYPYGNFLASVLGFTGEDGQGLNGLEAQYDEYLTGTPGRLVTAKNALGTDMPYDYEQMVEPKDGCDLILTIDEVVQHFLEKYLEEGIEENEVKNRATAIVMDVDTGAILGLAVKGDYDPNDPFTIVDELKAAEIATLPEDQQAEARNEALQYQWRNKAVSDTYQPGSVFKIITAAMGLEEGVVNEESSFYCSGSYKPVENAQSIGCHVRTGHGQQTFLQALCNSCNPAFMQLGLNIGIDRFNQYFGAFGFLQKTGIDLPGESNSIYFNQDSMTQLDLAIGSFGQGEKVTPIQMITAVAAVANGGKLVQPHIVDKIVDSDGNIVKTAGDTVKRQVISEETSQRLCSMLETNAIQGSGKNGYIPGYRVAGKTGTSEKIGEVAIGPGEDYIASYCGFAPADDPEVVMLVFYDTPKGPNGYYGSGVAAPTFRKVMENVLPYLGVERRYTDAERAELDTTAPNTIGNTVEEAQQKLSDAGLTAVVKGSGDTVLSQIPDPDATIPKEGSVVLYTEEGIEENEKVTVPNLVGLTLSQANQQAVAAGLNFSISAPANSEDAVLTSVSQSISEGTEVSPGTVITVTFIQKDNVE